MEFDPQIHAIGEILDPTSETIQGQSLTVQEILIKFSQGVLPPIKFPTYYDEEPDYDSFDPTLSGDFDLSDTDYIEDRISALNESIADIHKKLEEVIPSNANIGSTEPKLPEGGV